MYDGAKGRVIPRPVEISTEGGEQQVAREWVPEVPVALEFNGLAYAVMMATPSDLEDFARGFALTEGLAKSVTEVCEVAAAETDMGWIVRTTLSGLGVDKLAERVRMRVAESSCGLCGIESLEALARALPQVAPHEPPKPAAVFASTARLRESQQLNRRTGAAHAAGFAAPNGALLMLREDVGRHNALDKLIGALAAEGVDPAVGFLVSTARCSYEIVEKAVRAGAHSLVTLSLPTSMAVERAQAAGLTLLCLARDDSFLRVC